MVASLKNLTFRSTNRYLSLALLALSVITLLLLGGWYLMPAAAAPLQVGVSIPGQNAFEFIGQIDQNGPDFTGFGYLTYIRDLDNTQIFTDPFNPSEDTARFTYVATATLTSRAVLTEVFTIDSIGTITFYYADSPPDRSFDNSASFASGAPIATATLRYQDILLVQASNTGLATGAGEITQLSAAAFTLGGQSYEFGQPNLLYRYSTVGNGHRTDPAPPFHLSYWQATP